MKEQDWPKVTPDDDGIRPLGKPDQCFYCNARVGECHGKECVTVSRRVKVKYELEIEVDIPHFWTAHDFEFHRNESSWCADNIVNDIKQHLEQSDRCLCGSFTATLLNDVDYIPRTRAGEAAKP